MSKSAACLSSGKIHLKLKASFANTMRRVSSALDDTHAVHYQRKFKFVDGATALRTQIGWVLPRPANTLVCWPLAVGIASTVADPEFEQGLEGGGGILAPPNL